jgi:hypothetical protein
MKNISAAPELPGGAQTDDKLAFVIGSCPACTSGTGGWALVRGFYELMFALHWQSPDEGHGNVRVLTYVLNYFFKK